MVILNRRMQYHKSLMLFVLLMEAVTAVLGQSREESIRIQDSIYQANIKRTRINGVYIPKDLNDAFLELNSLSDAESKTKFRLATEDLIAKKLHFGLGRWMAVNWNFEEGSRMSHYLTGMGLLYTDDMIDFMLRMYHRYLNQKPLEAEQTAKSYQLRREKEYRENLKDKYGIDSVIIRQP